MSKATDGSPAGLGEVGEHVERRPETLEQTLRRVLREELPKARRTKR